MRRGCGPAFSLCAMSENDFEGLWVRLPVHLAPTEPSHLVTLWWVSMVGMHAAAVRDSHLESCNPGQTPHQVPPLSVVPIPIANILTNALISVDIEWPNHGEIIAKRK